jgi:hypothetical protein
MKTTAGACYNLGSMLRYFHRWARNIKYLPRLIAMVFSVAQIATAFADALHTMLLDMVRIFNLFQAMSLMSRLAATRPGAPLTQVRRLPTLRIAAGWLAAIMAVLGDTSFKFYHTFLQLYKCILQSKKHLNDGIYTTVFIYREQLLPAYFLYRFQKISFVLNFVSVPLSSLRNRYLFV